VSWQFLGSAKTPPFSAALRVFTDRLTYGIGLEWQFPTITQPDTRGRTQKMMCREKQLASNHPGANLTALTSAGSDGESQAFLSGKAIKKGIVPPKKLVNIVAVKNVAPDVRRL